MGYEPNLGRIEPPELGCEMFRVGENRVDMVETIENPSNLQTLLQAVETSVNSTWQTQALQDNSVHYLTTWDGWVAVRDLGTIF